MKKYIFHSKNVGMCNKKNKRINSIIYYLYAYKKPIYE